MIKRYRMLKDSSLEPQAAAGTVVYSCANHDYGLASDDSRLTGKPHRSVTLKSDGDYPFFTVPEEDIELIAD